MGFTTALAIGGGLAAAGGIASGVSGAIGAGAAADSQRAALALQKELFDRARRDVLARQGDLGRRERMTEQQFLEALAGYQAQADAARQYMEATGQTGALASQQLMQLLSGQGELSQGAQFQLARGQEALDLSAAARGALNSGATLKALQEFGQGVAAQDYARQIQQLSGLQAAGNQAAVQGAQLSAMPVGVLSNYAMNLTGQNTGLTQALAALAGSQSSQGGQAYSNISQAQMAGANAVGGGINEGLGNMATLAVLSTLGTGNQSPTKKATNAMKTLDNLDGYLGGLGVGR